MKCLATTALGLLPLCGCSGWVVFISPTGVACSDNVDIIPSPTRPPASRIISTGVTVHGTLSSCHLADEFVVAAVADGTLVVRLRWNTSQTSTVSVVSINGEEFRSRPPDWPLVVARVPVRQGQEYRLRIALQGSSEIPEDRYQLTTDLE
jgi:hypothetical protein